MKRILPLLLVLMLLTPAIAEAPLFSGGPPHASTPGFRQYFRTMTAQLPSCTLAIAERIFAPEEAMLLYSAIAADLDAIAAYTGIPLQPHTVYVVERLVNGCSERQGSAVYCSAEDVLSGVYRPLLICAALGTEEYWIGVGLAGCIWGSDADESVLPTHYDSGGMSLLTLALPYFLPDFATPEEIAIARATAVSLCRYATEIHGCAALLADDGVTLRQHWLHAMGIALPFDDPCCTSLRQYRFRASSDWSLIAEDPFGNTFYIAPMQDVSTAEELRWFLHDLIAGPAALLSLIEEEAPACAPLLRGRYGKLRVYCGKSSGSWSVPEYREIHLALGSGFMHELTHILVPAIAGANYYTTMWQYEGLCYWAGYQVYPMQTQRQQILDALHFFADMSDPQTPNHRFSTEATRLYLQHGSMPDSPEAASVPRYAHAMALVPLRFPGTAEGAAWAATISDSYPALRTEGGNELTEYQAYSFTAFLIDRCGLPAFLSFCMNGDDFAATFGESYESARSAWITHLDRLFP